MHGGIDRRDWREMPHLSYIHGWRLSPYGRTTSNQMTMLHCIDWQGSILGFSSETRLSSLCTHQVRCMDCPSLCSRLTLASAFVVHPDVVPEILPLERYEQLIGRCLKMLVLLGNSFQAAQICGIDCPASRYQKMFVYSLDIKPFSKSWRHPTDRILVKPPKTSCPI
ncbi:uncharacterized protein BDW43DRAFT_294252 [Aspergillus alliaceus]|uniref:uncharacterized protein n=1 Tax=Petromyces alliaceus TaxID=209559 RepID=UPI0012A3F2BE|nr:uncharacterized protein BDW43DRAFT_294252 [Aspergillus alliaceus]KAB8227425.1 hypothetical protein BDW43DRAFT_294252 [Aspergillus alliaceus]